MKKTTVIAAALILALALQGCGTFLSIAEIKCSDAEFGVYSGVRTDAQMMDTTALGVILLCLDLPISFVMDTILLPVSLTYELFADGKGGR